MALGIDLLGSASVAILLACAGIAAIVAGYKLYAKQPALLQVRRASR